MKLDQSDSEICENSFRGETISPATSVGNDTQGTKRRLQKQIAEAQLAIEECSTALSATRAGQMRALTALYAVALEFDKHPEDKEEFLEQAGVKTNGNTRNRHQPVVKAFLKASDQIMKARVTKYANCIGLAEITQIPAEEFSKLIEDEGGIEKAAKKYSKASRPTITERNEDARNQEAAIQTYLGDKPALDCQARAVGGYRGRQLAIIECNGDETFGVYRVVELDPDRIRRFVLRHAQTEKR